VETLGKSFSTIVLTVYKEKRMAIVKLLKDSLPNWQAGIEVELEGKRLEEALADGSAELTEPAKAPKVKAVVVEEKPKKKAKYKILSVK
jgi:hypothetical protein